MENGNTALVLQEPAKALARQEDFGISIDELMMRVDKIREVRRRVMKNGVHYGKIPGVDKDTLFKAGAETLCMAFQLVPKFKPEERWDGAHLEVVITCTLVHSPTGTELGDGIGSCSTKESKYGYRKAQRKCPKCGQEGIIKGKEQYGGGWLCWKKNGGCDAKFKDGDQSIEGQVVGRVENPDIADQYNTVRKMACKRAHVAATLFVTGASELFTQDAEDMVEPPRQERSRSAKNPPVDQKSSKYMELSTKIASAETLEELEALTPQLQVARTEKSVSPDEYRSLRDEYAEAVRDLGDTDTKESDEADGVIE